MLKLASATTLSFRSHCDLSIERICLGTNMADSNRRQGKSHMGENEEFLIIFCLGKKFSSYNHLCETPFEL